MMAYYPEQYQRSFYVSAKFFSQAFSHAWHRIIKTWCTLREWRECALRQNGFSTVRIRALLNVGIRVEEPREIFLRHSGSTYWTETTFWMQGKPGRQKVISLGAESHGRDEKVWRSLQKSRILVFNIKIREKYPSLESWELNC